MQAQQTGSHRSTQRRTPTTEGTPAPHQAPPSHSASSSQVQPHTRNSFGGSKSAYRRANPSQQLSQIEKSVTHLLVATKQLLETLTQWSRHNATEAEVSDVYVRLGYEFNIASRAFNAIGVDTADLGNVPDLLRSILEDTLSQEASPASLDRYLPRIRDIIINLLHGLKRKQQKLRQRQAKDENSPVTGPVIGSMARQDSMSSTGSVETGTTAMVDDQQPGRYGAKSGQSSAAMGRSMSRENTSQDESSVPPRVSSSHGGRASPLRSDAMSQSATGRSRPGSSHRTAQSSNLYGSSSSISSNAAQNMPVIGPYPQDDPTPTTRDVAAEAPANNFPPPPPPPPKQHDALAALQRGGDLERRASRRYSAYQISKHLGSSANGMPMLPPAQNSPIPNRGREVRESMNAVRIRGSLVQPKAAVAETSPHRGDEGARFGSDEGQSGNYTSVAKVGEYGWTTNSVANSPADKVGPSMTGGANGRETAVVMGATLTGPPANEMPMAVAEIDGEGPESPQVGRGEPGRESSTTDKYLTSSSSTSEVRQFIPEQSPQPGKELTLFLQYKSKIKKFVLPDGANDLSVARLQLAFIEKFAWSTHSNGIDLPEIYIQDPVSGVRHELEDLNDVKDRSVLVLNVEVLDEVKKHIDEGIGGLKRMVEGVRGAIDGQQSTIMRVSDRQMDASKAIARLAAGSVSVSEVGPASKSSKPMTNGVRSITASIEDPGRLGELHSLRRDLAVMRQTYTGFVTDIESSMASVRAKASTIKAVAAGVALPVLDGESGRAYVNKGKKEVGEVSDGLVNKVDDLQDIVEDLRKDVVTRGVRPLPRQLENVGRDIANATIELKKMQEFLRREKPKWSKIWEKELQVVCDDRDLLTMQEALAADLQDDLDNAAQTFALVEEATKEQMKDAEKGQTPRSTSRGLISIVGHAANDPLTAKEGVLGEVRALQPNHENRLEAIERAEKARQKELESRRGGEFQKELGSFVEEGRLKKSGGVEEAERLRKLKDERNRREVYERQGAREKAKAAKAADGLAENGASTGTPPNGQSSPALSRVSADDKMAGSPHSAEHPPMIGDASRFGEGIEHSRPANTAWPEMPTGP